MAKRGGTWQKKGYGTKKGLRDQVAVQRVKEVFKPFMLAVKNAENDGAKKEAEAKMEQMMKGMGEKLMCLILDTIEDGYKIENLAGRVVYAGLVTYMIC